MTGKERGKLISALMHCTKKAYGGCR